MLANSARRQVHDLAQNPLQLALFDLPGAVEIHVYRQWLSYSDRVRKLNGAAIREPGQVEGNRFGATVSPDRGRLALSAVCPFGGFS